MPGVCVFQGVQRVPGDECSYEFLCIRCKRPKKVGSGMHQFCIAPAEPKGVKVGKVKLESINFDDITF